MNFNELLQPKSLETVNATVQPWMSVNLAFYGGDHLQNGAGWIGPGPLPSDGEYGTFIKALSPAFISGNIIGTVTDNKTSGYCNDDIKWTTVLKRPLGDKEKPSKEEEALMAEADTALMEWWNNRDLMSVLNDFTTSWELLVKAGLRRYVPPGKLNDAGLVPTVGTLPEALDYIYAECPSYSNFTVYADPDTKEQIGIYCYTEIKQVDGKDTEVATAELSYLEVETVNGVMRPVAVEAGKKRRTVLVLATEKERETPLVQEMGGYLWHFEVTGKKPLITEQVRSLQRFYNLCKTTGRKNMADNGWLEEFLLNCKLPGKFEDPNNPSSFVPDPVERGPNKTRDLKPHEVDTAEGKKVIPASVAWRPIVDPSGAITTAEDAERAIHKETGQLHTLDNGGGNVSGETLKQRRATFEVSLKKSAPVLAKAVRWLLESALAQAALYMGQPGRYEGLRIECTPKLKTGPLSAEELNELTNRMDKRYLSEETGMQDQGVTDYDAERRRLDAEEARRNFGESYHPAMDGDVAPATADATGGDPNAVDENGNPVAAGVATQQALNSAQYDGLLKTLGLFSAGILAEATAQQGLIALGIEEGTAKTMLASQRPIKLSPEQLTAAGV